MHRSIARPAGAAFDLFSMVQGDFGEPEMGAQSDEVPDTPFEAEARGEAPSHECCPRGARVLFKAIPTLGRIDSEGGAACAVACGVGA
jgi:hypothetical protein